MIVPKDAKECLITSGHVTNTVAIKDWAVFSNKPEQLKKIVFTITQDIHRNVYLPKAKININRFSSAFWSGMDAAAKFYTFNFINGLRFLKARNSIENSFIKLYPSNIQIWIDRIAKLPFWLFKIDNKGVQCWFSCKRKINVWQKYPQVILHIENAILSIRVIALHINRPISQNLMMRIILTECAQILKEIINAAESS